MSDDKLVECKGRAGLYGLAVGSITFAGVYFAQDLGLRRMLNRNKNYKKLFVINAALFAIPAAYISVDARLKECDRRHEVSRFDALAKFKH